jgi:septal ring factor EnvC (AmiA/AmiB activator)
LREVSVRKPALIIITCIILAFLFTHCNSRNAYHAQDDISALGKRIDEMESHISELESLLIETTAQISDLETTFSELEEQTDKNVRMIDYLDDQVNRIQYDLN